MTYSQAEEQGSGRHRIKVWLVRASIPLLLWAFATVLFALDLGRLGDDHGATLRRPETGEIVRVFPRTVHFFHRPFDAEEGHFWRPLYLPWIMSTNSLLWNHVAWLNLLDAVLYLGAAGVFFLLLRALSIGRSAAVVAAAVFIVYPAYGQVVFWKAASGTTIAAALTLVAYITAIAYMRPERPRWLMLPVLAMLAFAVPAFNEQPAPALAALPLFMLAGRRRGMPLRPIVLRIATVTLLVGGVCALYGTMMLISGRDAYQPHAVEGFFSRTLRMLADLIGALALREFAGASLAAGWTTLAGAPVRTVAGLAMLGLACVPWLRRLRAEAAVTHGGGGEQGAPSPRRGLIVLAALAAFALTLPPIILIKMYPVWDSRFLFAPGVMLAIALGAGLDGLVAWWRGRSAALRGRMFPVWGAGLVTGLLLLAVMMVGSQEPYRRRANADVAQAAMLRELVPDPAKHTFFLPLDVRDSWATRIASEEAGSRRWYGISNYSVWHWPWTVRQFIGETYRRPDVRIGFSAAALPRVVGVEDEGLRYAQIEPGPWPYKPHPNGGFLVPWDKVVPFVVLEDGTVEVVTALELPNGHVVPMKAVRGAVEAGRVGPRQAELSVWTGG